MSRQQSCATGWGMKRKTPRLQKGKGYCRKMYIFIFSNRPLIWSFRVEKNLLWIKFNVTISHFFGYMKSSFDVQSGSRVVTPITFVIQNTKVLIL